VTWEPFGPTRRLAEDAGPVAPPVPSAGPARELPAKPRHALVVITCMDARIDPLAACGLGLGDAHVLRNAGAVVSDDVLRSLHASHTRLGTRRALLIGHTDCVAFDGDLAAVEASLRQGLRTIAGSGVVPPDFRVDALVYDLETGELRPL
jgi:carbonic anhydrase